jgi:polysaccharide biosynthesis/export protein
MHRLQLRNARLGLVLSLVVMAMTLAGCGGNSGTGAPYATQSLAPATGAAGAATQVTGGANETTTSAITEVGRHAPEYGIGPGDVLQVSVFDVPSLTSSVQVSAEGTILLPLIGVVKVAGESTSQASRQIAEKLAEKYLQSPQVSVFVSHSAQRVSVNGAVEHPGVITLDGMLTLSQAVAEAGGANDVSDENRVHIARLMGNQKVNDTVFDLEAIKGGGAQDPILHSGDIVVVEESGKRMAFKTILQLVPAISAIGTIGLMGMGL